MFERGKVRMMVDILVEGWFIGLERFLCMRELSVMMNEYLLFYLVLTGL